MSFKNKEFFCHDTNCSNTIILQIIHFMHKIKYLHGSSYFKYEDVEKDDDDGAAERPATLSTVTATESESQAEMKYWFRV